MGDFGIGELSKRTDVAIATIRFYEQEGLLPRARRNGRHRSYDLADVRRLGFIRNSRKLGFSMEQVKALVHLAEPENATCDAAREMAAVQLKTVQENIRAFKKIERDLQRNIAACDAACCGGARVEGCGVLG